MKKQSKLGFSLIELSVVILVIGILVIGITQGSRIIREAKLKSAQSLTQSSPVNSISGLLFWLETTSTKSFDSSEAQNSNTLTNWYNINPHTNSPIGSTQSSASSKPLYIASGINGLPVVRFDGSNDHLTTTLDRPINSNQIEVFMVCKRNQVVAHISTSVFYNSSAVHDYDNTQSFNFAYEAVGGTILQTERVSSLSIKNTHPGNGVPYIVSTSFNGTNNTLWVNGQGQTPVASTGSFNINRIAIATRYISGALGGSYNGDIAEFIVFNRALKALERKSVEQYLSQKYNIKIS